MRKAVGTETGEKKGPMALSFPPWPPIPSLIIKIMEKLLLLQPQPQPLLLFFFLFFFFEAEEHIGAYARAGGERYKKRGEYGIIPLVGVI